MNIITNRAKITATSLSLIHIYNNVKHKYELVSTKDMSGLNLSTPGKYMITAKPIREGRTAVRYIPVSYTHLDVYKRQAYMYSCVALENEKFLAAAKSSHHEKS